MKIQHILTNLRFQTIIGAVLLALSSEARANEPVFTDVTDQAGVHYIQRSPDTPVDGVVNGLGLMDGMMMSGGAAVADYDGDGFLDLFVTRIDSSDILFRNNGDGTFTDRTSDAGLDSFVLRSNGASFADIDNDGDPDLYVNMVGESRNFLFINDGSGVFTEEAVERGAAAESEFGRGGFSVSFGDYDRDGWLDIHTTEWRQERIDGLCPPSHNRLLRNRGMEAPGQFEDVTYSVGVALEGIGIDGVGGFASAFSDLDHDGWPDLAIAIDFRRSRLFWNDGEGGFIDGTDAAGVGSENNGMGSTIGDFDGDGLLDWFVTAIYDPFWCIVGWHGNRLYRNLGGRVFADDTLDAGVINGSWGWGAAFLDFDNDGDLDLTMTNGVAWDDRFLTDQMRFWRNDGGVFAEIADSVGVTDTASGKGLLTFDYDNDGDIDIFVVNNGGGPKLYRNDGGNSFDWLRVRVVGERSNRDGLGAKITVTPTEGGASRFREVNSSSFFLGQGETIAHFGLGEGDAPVARVAVEWPLGGETVRENVARNTTLTIVESASELPPAIAPAPRLAPADPPSSECVDDDPLQRFVSTFSDIAESSGPCNPLSTCPLVGFLGIGAMVVGLVAAPKKQVRRNWAKRDR
jgi:hypothetical protein